MIFTYENIKNKKNCLLFLNKNYSSKELFNLSLSSPDGFVEGYLAHSMSIKIYNNMIKCYYTDCNKNYGKNGDLDRLMLSCLTYDYTNHTIISTEHNIISGMITYNFDIIEKDKEEIIVGGHHPTNGVYWRKTHITHNCPDCKKLETFSYRGKFRNDRGLFLSTDKFNKCNLNGCYIMNLKDKNYLNNLPIIHLNTKHNNPTQKIHFDTNLSIVYNKNIQKYIIFMRSNIKEETRFVSYSLSTDLINWDPFNYINIDNYDYNKQNYYYFNCYNYYDLFISFSLYGEDNHNPNNKYGTILNGGTYIMYSPDGYSYWQDIGYFNKYEPCQPKINWFSRRIVGINLDNENYDEIFENTGHVTNKQSIISHKFPKYSIFGITNDNNSDTSEFTIEFNLNKKNRLIAEIEENGFITAQFDEYELKFTNKNKEFIIETNNNKIYNIKFIFKNAKLFAII